MRRSVERVASFAGQLAMIAVGAYLGLQAEQWREDRSRAALAKATLHNFRDEIAANRATVARVRPYHDSVAAGINRVFQAQLRTGERLDLIQVTTRSGYDGWKPVEFQSTAYDLALATQALGELPPALGLRLARLYTQQRAAAAFEDQFAQAMMVNVPAPHDDATRALFMLQQGLQEFARADARLTRAYDAMLPALDSALARR